MTESDRIANAETVVRKVLESAGHPVTSTELGQLIDEEEATPSRSLVRLAVQRMIGRGTVDYGHDRRYSLRAHQPQV